MTPWRLKAGGSCDPCIMYDVCGLTIRALLISLTVNKLPSNSMIPVVNLVDRCDGKVLR